VKIVRSVVTVDPMPNVLMNKMFIVAHLLKVHYDVDLA